MKLNNITIFKYYEWPFPPFQTAVDPSSKTISFLTKLLNDDYFQNKVIDLRKKYIIPKNGYNVKLLERYKQPNLEWIDPPKNGTYDIKLLEEKMKNDIVKMVKFYNLDKAYNFLFFLLITHNAFIEVESKDTAAIDFSEINEDTQNLVKAYKDPIGGILIFNDITKAQLKKWIDENWETNKHLLTFRQKLARIPREKGTYKNAVLDSEIADLKINRNDYKQIADILSNKYPANENILDAGWLKMRYSRYKNKKLK